VSTSPFLITMKTRYPFITLKTIDLYMPLIIEYKVSVQARKPNQFLDVYKQYGKQMPIKWLLKRENFIKRHLVQYRENPTVRRRLAIITWAYDPETPSS
jgi:hypothetical protein